MTGATRPSGTTSRAAGRALGRPYPAAYSWFRYAECVLGSRGPRGDAERALAAAAATCRRLGAVPLGVEIGRLARLARIDVETESEDGGGARMRLASSGPRRDLARRAATAGAEAGDGDDDAAARLGLTDREVEVLRLVGAGRSNQQIGDALFITRKTASVHVSNILGKLGVDNRIEAAVVAHRLGLTDEASESEATDAAVAGRAPGGRSGSEAGRVAASGAVSRERHPASRAARPRPCGTRRSYARGPRPPRASAANAEPSCRWRRGRDANLSASFHGRSCEAGVPVP